MATAFSKTSTGSNLYFLGCRQNNSFSSPSPSFLPSSRFHSQTLFLLATPHLVLRGRIAVSPLGPPTPPSPDSPPPKQNTTQLTSLVGVASRIQEHVKIFLALLIWISLFFWASALQGRDRGNGKGKKKGSRFKSNYVFRL